MYTLATCTVTILRPTLIADALGDKRSVYMPQTSGVLAAIQETGKVVQDFATQTPRSIRSITGTFPHGTDLQTGDRVRDDRFNVVYEIQTVTQQTAAGYLPDLKATMKKVTS
jgi:hypothetical protein